MSSLSATAHGPIVRAEIASAADRDALASCTFDPATLVDDGFDYSRVVVRKPWGYEYLMFQNDAVAVWILRLLPGASTSLHCHVHKTTSLVVLSGEACCRRINESVTRKAGEGLVIGAGVFHQTTAISPDGVFLMEIETPVNKRDLIRLSDAYGRTGLGYETAEHMTVNTANYNRLSFFGESIFYNIRKRFQDTTVRLVRADQAIALSALTQTSSSDLIGVLRGRVFNHDTALASAGEFVACSNTNLRVEAGFEGVIVSYADRMSRVADVIVGHLRSREIGAFFFSPGTTNAHLVDAVAREGEGAFIPQTSDAAAAHAAVAHAKITGRPTCCILSAGAAATSAVTAVAEAWTDSTPVLFLCAQTRLTTFTGAAPALRQLANKEVNSAALVRPITKKAGTIKNPLTLRVDLDRMLALTIAGRPGPAWLDVPIDVLGQAVDEALMATSTHAVRNRHQRPRTADVDATLAYVRAAQKPVLLLGHGIRLSGAQADALQLIKRLGWPTMTTRRGADLVSKDESLLCGRPGTYGRASANETIQECDLLLCIGARLELPLVSRNPASFAASARKIVVDLDPAELSKPTLTADLTIRSDAGAFIRALLAALSGESPAIDPKWRERCTHRRDSDVTGTNRGGELTAEGLDPFVATAALSSAAPADAVIIAEGGVPLDYVMREWQFRGQQRLISSTGLEGDGFSLAAAVGASLAHRGRRIVCLCEAGAFLRSTPELATLLNYQLPVTIVLFSAADDRRVRETQARYFGERHVSAAPQNALANQVVTQCLAASAVPVIQLTRGSDLDSVFAGAFPARGPLVCLLPIADDAHLVSGPAYEVRPDGRWKVSAPARA
jgi:acetolactate synthase I/II/III large subunit